MYARLSSDQQQQLRAERILGLEADHFRAGMVLAELPADAPSAEREAMLNDLADLERRIAVHSSAGKPAEVAEAPAETESAAQPEAKGAANGRVPARR